VASDTPNHGVRRTRRHAEEGHGTQKLPTVDLSLAQLLLQLWDEAWM
jgi:hypothetical protein